ncbi:MAG: hypothetical protein N7Q72_05135 [Spiroplasma sp. Tabriz.8]|nr:hypothetical protein [Spiroplasma sp. Tabriz.8]
MVYASIYLILKFIITSNHIYIYIYIYIYIDLFIAFHDILKIQ